MDKRFHPKSSNPMEKAANNRNAQTANEHHLAVPTSRDTPCQLGARYLDGLDLQRATVPMKRKTSTKSGCSPTLPKQAIATKIRTGIAITTCQQQLVPKHLNWVLLAI